MTKKKKNIFSKVLIANRGEIACRIIAACRSLGLHSIAIFSEADTKARHVRLADEAVFIGPGPAVESYLNLDKILQAAKDSGAQAVHPGYGFLSEQALFAEAVLKAGLVWIGPDPKVMDLMGNKIAAKKIVQSAKIPTLKWTLLEEGYSIQDLKTEAKKIGFPLLLKAALGGGGRGMRLVERPEELEAKTLSAVEETKSTFGSTELFLESYCQSARHIEVQVVGDRYGNVITLGERECSIQRRHQKVIEETPAHQLSQKTRKALWRAALKLSKLVGYTSVGTCEFLVDEKEKFYFLEMNTRLQVEHPVTELVWGVDLVCLQIKIAQGEILPKKFTPRGHAIEARLYAENPAKGFMPSPGKIETFETPLLTNLRLDSGYESGDEVPLFYDSMLAKMIAWGMDREHARRTLVEGLSSTSLTGVTWNGAYLIDILKHEKFIQGELTTRFLEQNFSKWQPHNLPTDPKFVATNAEFSPWVYYGKPDQKRSLEKSVFTHTTIPIEADETIQLQGPLVSEYPGKVLKVLVRSGQKVNKGQIVVVCESMKMEFSYTANFETTVKEVKVREGQVIPAGTLLVEWAGGSV